MTLQIWIALAVANYVTAVSPGQNVALISASTARSGPKAGYIAMGGILVADLVWCLLALGLAVSAQEISPNLLLTVQMISGAILVGLGFKIAKATRTMAAQNDTQTKGRSTLLVAQGFWIGFANPLTLVFFLTLFPAFMPSVVQTTTHASMVLFYGSAVVLSGMVALLPYIFASLAITKSGFGKALNLVSGVSLASVGGLVMVQSFT